MEQRAEGSVHLLAEVHDDVAHAPRRIGAKRRSGVVQREAAVVELAEHACRDKRAKDAAQLGPAGVDRLRDGVGRQRSGAEAVGDTKLRRDVERLRELIALREPRHLLL